MSADGAVKKGRVFVKKLSFLICILALSVSLAACGKGDSAPEPGTSLHVFYDAILAAQPENAEELIFFEESDPALIDSFYPGLDGVALEQQAFYMPPIVTHPCEIVLVEVSDAADAQAVADIFQARIQLGADDTTYPESAAGWQVYAQVQHSGTYVGMVVLPEGYVVPENVFAQ